MNIAGEKTSRVDIARTIARTFDLNQDLIVETGELLSLKALRPYDSSLDISKAKRIIDFDFYSVDANMRSFRTMLRGW